MAQEIAKMATLEPRWSQQGPNMVQDAPIRTQKELDMAQGSVKIGLRWPSWSEESLQGSENSFPGSERSEGNRLPQCLSIKVRGWEDLGGQAGPGL